MRHIAHRGNIDGRHPPQENTPTYVIRALRMNYDVEIDVWRKDGDFYLGHDEPQHKIWESFLHEFSDRLWIHCKDLESLNVLAVEPNLNVFFHNVDDAVLTSQGHVWTYPNKKLYGNSVCVMPELGVNGDLNLCYGICSDYIKTYK